MLKVLKIVCLDKYQIKLKKSINFRPFQKIIATFTVKNKIYDINI